MTPTYLFLACLLISASGAQRNDSVYIEDPSCGISYASSGVSLRIVGGNETRAGEFPWLVSLQYDGRHMCGASVIHGRFILTAAHCFQDKGVGHPHLWRILAGRHRLSASNGIEVKVLSIILHYSYSADYNENDIALIKLKTPLPDYSRTIAPICLASSSHYLAARTPVTVAGWGNTVANDPGSYSDVVRSVDVYTYDSNRCAGIYKFWVKDAKVVPFAMVCAGDLRGGRDSCQGDSGGPLMQRGPDGRWTQVGLVSWGASCGRPFLAGVYTKISAYRKWIEETIANNKASVMPACHIFTIIWLLPLALIFFIQTT